MFITGGALWWFFSTEKVLMCEAGVTNVEPSEDNSILAVKVGDIAIAKRGLDRMQFVSGGIWEQPLLRPLMVMSVSWCHRPRNWPVASVTPSVCVGKGTTIWASSALKHGSLLFDFTSTNVRQLLYLSGTICLRQYDHRHHCQFSAVDWRLNFLPGLTAALTNKRLTALTTTWPHYYCYVSLQSQDLCHGKLHSFIIIIIIERMGGTMRSNR